MVQTVLGNNINLVMNEHHNSVLVIGCIHGDEPQGKFLIEEYLNSHKNTKLMFIPCLNPDGVKINSRLNANGVDINRNFPTKNWEHSQKGNFYGGTKPCSEIETVFLVNVVENCKPSIILTLHAPYKIVNYDGNAEDIAQKFSKIIGYPVQKSIGYPTPGSFGTWAGVEKGIPTVTLELDEEIDVKELKKPVFEIFEMMEQES